MDHFIKLKATLCAERSLEQQLNKYINVMSVFIRHVMPSFTQKCGVFE